MPTEQLEGVTALTQANVYFDGKCVSHTVLLADGSKKTLGVILPASLSFNTGAPELMECVAGGCEYRLDGQTEWRHSAPGERFSVPANSRFELRCEQPYHYICHLG